MQVRVELQADCFAGLWAAKSDQQWKLIEPGDVEAAMKTAAAVGDDRLQKQAQGYAIPDNFTHGSSEQRQRWFMTRLKSGTVRACNTFAPGENITLLTVKKVESAAKDTTRTAVLEEPPANTDAQGKPIQDRIGARVPDRSTSHALGPAAHSSGLKHKGLPMLDENLPIGHVPISLWSMHHAVATHQFSCLRPVRSSRTRNSTAAREKPSASA
jgi:hypothetical protein